MLAVTTFDPEFPEVEPEPLDAPPPPHPVMTARSKGRAKPDNEKRTRMRHSKEWKSRLRIGQRDPILVAQLCAQIMAMDYGEIDTGGRSVQISLESSSQLKDRLSAAMGGHDPAARLTGATAAIR